MTRKDYKILAEVLNQWRDSMYSQDHKNIVESFCEALVKENPRFDRNKFLVASGLPQ